MATPENAPLEGAPPAPQATPPLTFSTDVAAFDNVRDPDEIELELARKEESTEGRTPAEGVAPPSPVPPAAPAARAPASSGAAPAAPPVPTIPKPRFDEVLNENRVLRDRAIYLEGVVEGAKAAPGATPAPGDQPRQPTPAEQLAAVETAIDGLATRYDNGELTMAEYEKQRRQLQRQEDQLRERQLLSQVDQRIPKQQGGSVAMTDKIVLQQASEKLEAEHPYVNGMSEAQVNLLVKWAYDEAAAQGQPIGEGPEATLRLRTAVAHLSDVHGPRWGVKPVQKPAPGGTPGQQPSTAADERARKLALEGNHPPDTSQLGTRPELRDDLSDANIAMMTDDMVEALPESVRRRLLQ